MKKTTFIKTLPKKTQEELEEKIYKALKDLVPGSELDSELDQAMSGRLSDVSETIDTDNLNTITLK